MGDIFTTLTSPDTQQEASAVEAITPIHRTAVVIRLSGDGPVPSGPAERLERFIFGSINGPKTMKADVYTWKDGHLYLGVHPYGVTPSNKSDAETWHKDDLTDKLQKKYVLVILLEAKGA